MGISGFWRVKKNDFEPVSPWSIARYYGDFGILKDKRKNDSPGFPPNSNRFARRITRSLWGFRDFGGNLSTILNNFRLGVSHATMGISGF